MHLEWKYVSLQAVVHVCFSCEICKDFYRVNVRITFILLLLCHMHTEYLSLGLKYKLHISDYMSHKSLTLTENIKHYIFLNIISYVRLYMVKKSYTHTQKVLHVSHPAVWGDEAGDAHKPSVSKQFYHFCDTTNVLFAVFRAEAQVLIEALPDVISIQSVAGDPMTHQILLQSHADRRLTRTRQTWGCRTNRSWYLLKILDTAMMETSSYSFSKNNRRGVDRIPVSHTVHPRNPPLVPTTWPRLFLLTWWAWYVTLVALCIPCTNCRKHIYITFISYVSSLTKTSCLIDIIETVKESVFG